MAAPVNKLGTLEFVQTGNEPVEEIKDNVIPAANLLSDQVVENEDPYLKEEVDLDWDQNDIEINGVASTNNTSSIDKNSLENMPIIILPAGSMKAVKGIIKKKILYMCKICRKLFDTSENLKEHALSCKLIGCQLCDFTTRDRSAFKIHWEHHQELEKASKKVLEQMEVALKKAKPKLVNIPNSENEITAKIYDCPNCSKKYRTVDQLKLHLFRCDKMQCKLCDFKTYKSYNLKRHFQISHQAPEELTMSCPKCKKVLKNPHSFSTHKWICGKIPRCECHDCGYKTFTKYNLRTHILAKHLQPDITREDLAKKNVQLEKFVLPATKVETVDPYARKVCNLCKRSYHNQRALSAHSIHCKLYECNQCYFETFRKAYLKKHIRLRHKSKEAPLPSQDETIPSVPMLADPVIQYDVPELPSTIDQDESSSLEPALASPVFDQHKMDSAFVDTEQMCKICYEIFPNEAALHAHSLNCREYQCTHCPYTTYIPADLDNHINQKHELTKQTNNDYAVCPKCNKHYKNDNVVISHLRYCGKESTKCDYCPFKSKRPGILKAHMQISHPHVEAVKTSEKEEKVKKDEKEEKVKADEKEEEVKEEEEENEVKKEEEQEEIKIEEEEMVIEKEEEQMVIEKEEEQMVIEKVEEMVIEKEEEEEMEENEEEVETITCDKCGQKLKDNETVAFHSFYCPRKPFLDCNMCSFKTRYGLCLKNHILRVHCQSNQEQESYECPKCSGRLTTQETFKKHVISCLPQSALRCSLCTYMTRDPSCLSDHVLDKHYKDDPSDTSDIKLIPCPKCGNKLKNPQSLRSHLMHCEKKPILQCPHCPHKSKMKTMLDRHVLTRHKAKR